MTPARIVIINDSTHAAGGATSLALKSAQLLSDAGHQVTFVTGDEGSRESLPETVDVVALGGKSLLDLPIRQRIPKGLYNLQASRFVRRVISELDSPDVVYHLHGWAQTLSPSILAPLWKVQDRLVIHAHDFFHACPNGTYFNFQTESVCHLKPLSSQCLRTNCDKRSASQKAFRTVRMLLKNQILDMGNTRALVAVIHPFMTDWMARAGIDDAQVRVVRNPVQPFRSDRVKAEANSDLFFIGRLEPEKGAELAAQAARSAGRRLRVIGDGSERKRLEAQYPEFVWEGWRSHAEIAQLIVHARGLIMPSRLPEPFGLVSLEAIHSGVPLIAFADSFVAREAADLGCAFVASERRPEALGAAVRALDEDYVVERASKVAFTQARDLSNSPEQWRDQLLSLYGELLISSQAPYLRQPVPPKQELGWTD